MINPPRVCLWGLWLCYPRQTCSHFGNSSQQWCVDFAPLGAVKHSWQMAHWSVGLDIPSLSGDEKLCLSQSSLPEKTEERGGNKGPARLDSQHSEVLSLASALLSGTCGCCIFICHHDMDLKNTDQYGLNQEETGTWKTLKRSSTLSIWKI